MSSEIKRGDRSRIVANRIRRMVAGLGPGKCLPTFRELMTEFSVSQSTVSSAIQQLIAEGLLETRPGKGVFVSTNSQTKPILMICETGAFVGGSPFWEMLLEAFVRIFKERPANLVTQFTEPTFEEREKIPVSQFLSSAIWPRIKAKRFSGVIALCTDRRLVTELEGMGLPVVGFGCRASTMVNLAMDGCCRMGTEELVRMGCNRIALYNVPSIQMDELINSIRSDRTLARHVLPPEKAFRLHEPQLGYRPLLFEHGAKEAERLFGPDSDPVRRPDGILSLDEKFTQGLILGLSRFGKLPGRDIRIATHYNLGSWVLTPWLSELTLMEFDPNKMASLMVYAIERLSAGEVPGGNGWEHSFMWQDVAGACRALNVFPDLRRQSAVYRYAEMVSPAQS